MSLRAFTLKEASCPRCRDREYIPYRDNAPCGVCNACLETQRALVEKLRSLDQCLEFLAASRTELEARLKKEFLWDGSSD